jgi:hypothetical protein
MSGDKSQDLVQASISPFPRYDSILLEFGRNLAQTGTILELSEGNIRCRFQTWRLLE